ncbi:lactosylceramide 1,3-N-acetyl-beta-D-glucosaminyltransferase A [Sabethes cyaneus]|uniref:lactosylceramide 1,3-N-acetyl-beta-D-glucosaminyltransferase A n=1 Tax=Sabethes cyaneus TaxID=53552 RepID=UPI00237D461E|nr:lactosylceramide 1,3-N-acetyl-beta-D-glucosaminyltransferase A [Sabethes cyaneus]XP_053684369.1 lactosylceramide 1,3-N-acetyl-beta-D-glucosaminyltransferase A [Sabethes cyaneus]XP_053684370.1 lactosylceramide 1,3-N-acetyl-beta-D-glucosaminyltransferase A [Sabethes cyaneus]
MFERRPLFGALIGLTLIVTVWHMSFQEATSGTSSSSSSSGSMYQESAIVLPPYMPASSLAYSTPLQFLPALPQPNEDRIMSVGIDETETGGGAGGSMVNQSVFPLLLSSILVNPLEMLPKDDYNNLIDLKDFKFIINFNNCSAESGRSHHESVGTDSLKMGDERRSPLVLVLVHSAPTNWYKRNTIRDTWGQYDPRAKLIFLIGAVNSSVLQRRLEQENRLYDDIVQGNFIDAYRNMTYKHVMALKWFTYHCPEAKYVLKVDDDVFVNTPVLYDVLESTSQRRRLLFCQEISKAPVKRTHRSKWYVSIQEYRYKYYPNHCPGYSIIYTPDVAFELYREAQQQPYFWIDDVHLTGTIARRINVTITPTGRMLLNRSQKDAILDRTANATDQLFFFTTPDLREGEIRRLWKAVTYSKNGR